MPETSVVIKDFNGFIYDRPTTTLPNNTLNLLVNCVIYQGQIEPTQGYSVILDQPAAPSYFLIDQIINDNQLWFYGTDDKIYESNGITSSDVTRLVGGDYSTLVDIGWDGGVYNNVAYLTNGVDAPQYKLASDTNFSNLTNFPVNTVCKHIRSFGSRIVAFGLIESGASSPTSLLISDVCDPNSIPPSWDSTDPTNLADRIELADTPGFIVEAVMLGGSLYVYKTDSVWRVSFIGGSDIDRVERVLGVNGAISSHCVQEFEGQHFVFGVGDCFVHNGVTSKGILSETNSTLIYDVIDQDHINRCFSIKDSSRCEISVFAPTSGTAGDCVQRLVWNWKTGNMGVSSSPNLRYGYETAVNPAVVPMWSDATWGAGQWDQDVGDWNQGSYNPSTKSVILVSTTNQLNYIVGTSLLDDGSNTPWYFFKYDLDLGDEWQYKMISKLILHAQRNDLSQSTVNVNIGTRNNLNSTITWIGAQPYIIGQTQKLDLRAIGRYVSISISGTKQDSPRISGFTLYGRPTGGR